MANTERNRVPHTVYGYDAQLTGDEAMEVVRRLGTTTRPSIEDVKRTVDEICQNGHTLNGNAPVRREYQPQQIRRERRDQISGWEPTQAGPRGEGPIVRPSYLEPLLPMDQRDSGIDVGAGPISQPLIRGRDVAIVAAKQPQRSL